MSSSKPGGGEAAGSAIPLDCLPGGIPPGVVGSTIFASKESQVPLPGAPIVVTESVYTILFL